MPWIFSTDVHFYSLSMLGERRGCWDQTYTLAFSDSFDSMFIWYVLYSFNPWAILWSGINQSQLSVLRLARHLNGACFLVFTLFMLPPGSEAMRGVDRCYLMWMYHHRKWGWTLEICPWRKTKVWLLLLFPLQACISHVTGELKCCVVRRCRIPISQTAPGSPTPLPASAIILLNNAESSLLLLSRSVVVREQQQQQRRAHCDAINMLIACR